ncbi:dynamin family protein [Streptomyces sp. NPDC002044]|uniref:dynamin family protein n=1 Tax=Streptomyces sp. NPDC002044 TaxID=3154662 RepID=UPI00331EA3BB
MDDYGAIRTDILAALTEAADTAHRAEAENTARSLEEARDGLQDDVLRVVVLGEFKAGKSSLLNALLDDVGEPPLLPEAEEIATSVAASVAYGDPERIDVLHMAGDNEGDDIDGGGADEGAAAAATTVLVDRHGLREHGTEGGNPQNRRGVLAVRIHTPSPRLRQGLVLVDTPGLGGPHPEHNVATRAALPGADAVLLALDATQPVLRSHLDTVRQAASAINSSDTPDALLFALTKTDQRGYEEILADTRAKLATATGRPAADLLVVPVSARAHQAYLRYRDAEDLDAGNLAGLWDGLWAALGHRGVPRVLGGALDTLDRAVQALIEPVDGQVRALEDGTRRTVGELRAQALRRQARLAELQKGKAQWRGLLRERVETMQDALRRDADERHAQVWDRFESQYLEEDAYLTDPQRLVGQLTADAAQVIGEVNEQADTRTAIVLAQTVAETGLALGAVRPAAVSAAASRDLVVKGRLGDRHRSGRFKRRLRDLSFGGSIGTTTGAFVGSVFPVVGTALGAAVGSLVGMVSGWRSAGRDLRNEDRRFDRTSLRTQLQPLKRRQANHLADSVKEIVKEFRKLAEEEMEDRIEQERESNRLLIAGLKTAEEHTTRTAGAQLALLRARLEPLLTLRARTDELAARTLAFRAACVLRAKGLGHPGHPDGGTADAAPDGADDLAWAEGP